MKYIVVEGTMESAFGKPLHECTVKEGVTPFAKGAKLPYRAENVPQYEDIAEVHAAHDFPNDASVVKIRNAQKKAAARGKAMTAACDEAGIIKPTTENDAQLRLREMFKLLKQSGKSEQEARDIASTTIGVEWDDSEDDE